MRGIRNRGKREYGEEALTERMKLRHRTQDILYFINGFNGLRNQGGGEGVPVAGATAV